MTDRSQMWDGTQWIPMTGSPDGDFLPLAGGTMAGFINLHADPTLDAHAATKKYVDDTEVGTEHTVSTNAPVGPNVGDVWVNPDEPPEATYLPLSGGTMTGDIDLGGNWIDGSEYLASHIPADLNLMVDDGWEFGYVNSGVLNIPSGVLGASVLSTAWGADWVSQLVHDYRDENLYLRTRNAGVWGSWRTALTSAGGTLTGPLVINSAAPLTLVSSFPSVRWEQTAGDSTTRWELFSDAGGTLHLTAPPAAASVFRFTSTQAFFDVPISFVGQGAAFVLDMDQGIQRWENGGNVWEQRVDIDGTFRLLNRTNLRNVMIWQPDNSGVSFTVPILAPFGTNAAPGFGFAGLPDHGMHVPVTGRIELGASGNRLFLAYANRTLLPQSYNDTSGSSPNVTILSDGRIGRQTSARRYKSRINYNMDKLADIELQPTKFYRKDDKKWRYGFIADDIAEQDELLAIFDDGEVENFDMLGVLAVLAAKVNRLENQ